MINHYLFAPRSPCGQARGGAPAGGVGGGAAAGGGGPRRGAAADPAALRPPHGAKVDVVMSS